MTTATASTKSKLPPEEVKNALSRDVHTILSVCIHQFKADQELEEKCFNVDAIVSGQAFAPKVRYERVQPAHWAKGVTPQGTDRPYSASPKGNFIPQSHFFPRFA